MQAKRGKELGELFYILTRGKWIPRAETSQTMKRFFVRDMKIPLCITLLALSCTLLIFAVGCNDSAVTEIEVDNHDEQFELIPPSANPEPPELVAVYLELWDEIDAKRGKTGMGITSRDEFVGRHNVRHLDTVTQMEQTAKGLVGKRLTYKMLTGQLDDLSRS